MKVTIDNIEYDSENMSLAQQGYIAQINDIMKQQSTLTMRFDQLEAAKFVFTEKLTKSLKEGTNAEESKSEVPR